MSWLVDNWPMLLTAGGSLGVGGVLARLYDRMLQHSREKRKQTDNVALDLVQQQAQRITMLEAGRESDRGSARLENELCHKNLEIVQQELNNLEGTFDGLLLALKHSDPEKHPIIIAEVIAAREGKRERRASLRGELRQDVQVAVSAHRLVRDAANGA
jgi:hypothetical protein